MKPTAILLSLLTSASLLPAAVIGSWNMDEASGNLLDSTGTLPAGTATGTPTYGTAGVPNGTYGSITVTNAGGTSLDYGPSTLDEFFTVGASNDNAVLNILGSGSFTVMSWINPNAPVVPTAATYRPISTGSAAGADRGWGFGLRLNNAAGTGSAIRFTSYGVADNDSSLFNVTFGDWIHIAATYNNGSISYFLNGNALDSDTSVFGVKGTANRLTIGSRLGGADADQVSGRLDGLQVYNTVLTAAEIQAAAAGAVSVPETGASVLTFFAALGMLTKRRR